MNGKVLVVDDASANRRVIVALLERAGYQPFSAGDADMARRLFLAERPDCVLTDYQMPGESGLDLLRSLRGLSDGRRLRAALLTGDANAVPPDAANLLETVLEKPVTWDQLRVFLEG